MMMGLQSEGSFVPVSGRSWKLNWALSIQTHWIDHLLA